jgi:hypothetical protein
MIILSVAFAVSLSAAPGITITPTGALIEAEK